MTDSPLLPLALCLLATLGELGWLAGAAWFLARFRPATARAQGVVTLILAATGRQEGLAELFADLARQTLRPRRLVLAVEAETDPVVAQALGLAHLLPFPLEIAVGGTEALQRSQKATNLIAALRRIDARDEAIVLFDVDVRLREGWLMDLVAPALRDEADVVHGGRWSLVSNASGPVRHLTVFLDRTLTLSPRQIMGRGYVWGGSIGIRAAALQRMNLPAAFDRALSTDGAIDRRIRELGLRLLFRRVLLVPTPEEGGEAGAWAFKRRQMQMIHLNHPPAWRLLGLALHLQGAAIPLALLALAGHPAAAPLLALPAAMGLARALAHDRAGRHAGAPDLGMARLVQWLIGAATPLASGFALAMFWSTARVRRVRWRHVEYEVTRHGEVRIARRYRPGSSGGPRH
jgi:hypothetical protein